MAELKIEGAWTALVTPFGKDGKVDWKGFDKNVEFQVAQGITGIVPAGTTGESPTLTWGEHNKVIDRSVAVANKRSKVMAGVGSNCTSESLEAAQHAAEVGADACLLVDCYYNGPSSLELRKEYYEVIAAALPQMPFVSYVIPGRTGTAILPEDLAILFGEKPNVCAVKDATADLERMARTRALAGEKYSIMSGDDDKTFEMMTRADIKANGVISVVSNVAPAAVEKFARLLLKGDVSKAEKLRVALDPLFKLVTVKAKSVRKLPNGQTVEVEDKFRNPIGIKVLMNALGMPSGAGRKPLGKMTAAGVQITRDIARTVWKNNPEILQPIATFYRVDIEERLSVDAWWKFMCYE